VEGFTWRCPNEDAATIVKNIGAYDEAMKHPFYKISPFGDTAEKRENEEFLSSLFAEMNKTGKQYVKLRGTPFIRVDQGPIPVLRNCEELGLVRVLPAENNRGFLVRPTDKLFEKLAKWGDPVYAADEIESARRFSAEHFPTPKNEGFSSFGLAKIYSYL